MKKTFLVTLVGLLLYAVPALSGQTAQDGQTAQTEKTYAESEYYYVDVPIEKIYFYRNGYIVLYQRGFHLARTYIPMEWFTVPTGKADMITLGSGPSWPHLAIYYKGGVFSHIRLYVRQSRGHETWGVVPFNVDLDRYFANIEEVKLEL